jgi:hypothetical protein
VSQAWIDCLGWAATAVFVGSYFFARPSRLRGAQMLGALLWMSYGVLIKASPVIVANMLVFSAAAWTLIRAGRVTRLSGSQTAPGRYFRR